VIDVFLGLLSEDGQRNPVGCMAGYQQRIYDAPAVAGCC